MPKLLTKNLIIVTPVYEDTEASSKLFQELSETFNKEVFIVAVDDGSVREPVNIENIQSANLEGLVIKLKRNMGHQKAISIGLGFVAEYIEEDQIVVVMDSDGEDTPPSIKKLINPLKSETIDVVVSKRKSRVETLKFKTFYIFYKWFFNFLTGKKINFGNFMALKAESVKRLASMSELGIHIAATVLSSKLRIKTLPLDRGPRYAGQSKMNFVGLVLHGFKGLMIFAEDVLVRVGIASASIAMLSIFGVILAIFLKMFGFATPGWFSIALGILFLIFIQTGALTLMILMLTGVTKSKSISTLIDYKAFIKEILHAKS